MRQVTELAPYTSTKRARAYMNDIVIRGADDSLLWIVTWLHDEAATWFSGTYAAHHPDHDVSQRGRHVVVAINGFKDARTVTDQFIND